MARLTDSQRRIAIAVSSVLALIAVIAGTLALTGARDDERAQRGGQSNDRAAGERGKERGGSDDADGRVPRDIVHATESGGKAVNITIDDGPDPVWTPQVLDVLRTNGVKATFCMIGPQAQAHPDLVKKVVAEGHRLCDHTVSHDITMDHKSVAYQKKQILDAKKMIENAAGGAKVRYYRAPGGAFTPDSRRIAAEHGMRPLGWNVDTKDFELPGSAGIVAAVKNELANGPTILFHDGGGPRGETVQALREVLPWLKSQGYGFSFPQITGPGR
ncbi:polysaccharide deacetylase family protein [Streptomyces sp. XD-27]|uniref:polysaccharide deacetylase family protein n=1 Tax=Streptomyces sp. XD-27 TaxID=3062779 RepID=UPI0026F4417D|nr:polysaccharide deacetylase family protein [Streptomyces sp. XD-27]WKX72579.1 polysaccharide deacetylase family protein [Streptomyces sp. XD-27]